jgi:hypothetical protein
MGHHKKRKPKHHCSGKKKRWWKCYGKASWEGMQKHSDLQREAAAMHSLYEYYKEPD